MDILDELAKSKFRSRFKLRAKELEYIKDKGLDTIHSHACDFIRDSAVKSITYDNGKEFTQHEKINKILNTTSYFCKPYHSWEKGAVENINGTIRRFCPKETDFDTITEDEIKRVENWIITDL